MICDAMSILSDKENFVKEKTSKTIYCGSAMSKLDTPYLAVVITDAKSKQGKFSIDVEVLDKEDGTAQKLVSFTLQSKDFEKEYIVYLSLPYTQEKFMRLRYAAVDAGMENIELWTALVGEKHAFLDLASLINKGK